MLNKILLVDDEEGIRKVLGISLQDCGYEVFTAPSGEEALDLFRKCAPIIVLTDIKMPGMDGIELLKKIKAEDPETEVIMITGHGDMELAVKSLQCEAADFVTKPINHDALQVALHRVHEKMEMRRMLRDYTENLEKMVEVKSRELVESERMASIGQTVATLAHSIKNIIGGLKGGMFVLEKGVELQHKEYLDEGWRMTRSNVEKIKNLCLDLLNYARDRSPDPVLCDPNQPAREVFQLMQSRASENHIIMEFDACQDLPHSWIDSDGIHCCLLNLVTNALDACSAAGGEAPHHVRMFTSIVEGHSIEYAVEDDGNGMDNATMEKVFKGFYSTKGTKGTGLGLMITRKIAEEHGGTVQLESGSEGTRFTVRIPLIKAGREERVRSI